MTTFNLPFSRMELCIINDPNLSPQAKILYGILVFLARQRSPLNLPSCQVSIKTLGSLMNRKDRTIQICLNELIARGVIIREAQYTFTPDGERKQVASLFSVLGSRSSNYPAPAEDDFYFAMVSACVLFDPDLTINEKYLFITLCHLANVEDDTLNTYARTLSERMDVSLSVIYRGLASLNEKGFLTIIPRFIGKTSGRSASTYIVKRIVTSQDDINDSTDPMGAKTDKDLLSIFAGEINRTYYHNIFTKADNFVARNGEKKYSDNSTSDQLDFSANSNLTFSVSATLSILTLAERQKLLDSLLTIPASQTSCRTWFNTFSTSPAEPSSTSPSFISSTN